MNTDKEKIKMARTFGASKFQILNKIVIPANVSCFINSLKINIRLISCRCYFWRILSFKSRTWLLNCIWWAGIPVRPCHDKCHNSWYYGCSYV